MSNLSKEDQFAVAGEGWKPIPRISRTIPFGYVVSEDDPDLLLPVPLELEALEKAKRYIKQYSYREVAQWITALTGRRISHLGLQKRLAVEQHRRRKAAAIQRWAKSIKNAQAKIEKLNSRTGAKEGQGGEGS